MELTAKKLRAILFEIMDEKDSEAREKQVFDEELDDDEIEKLISEILEKEREIDIFEEEIKKAKKNKG
jgi:hypothetical protein